MFVTSNQVAVHNTRIKDVVGVGGIWFSSLNICITWPLWGSEHEQELLDDMVSVHMGDHVVDASLEFLDDLDEFIVEGGWIFAQKVNQSLHNSGSMTIHWDLNDVCCECMHNPLNVASGAYFDDPLGEVVAKLVDHDIW